MKQSVLVIGHADADGYLITEQVRRNLSSINRFDVRGLVDPERTRNHKVWLNLESLTEIEDADLVFFVDLMFSPNSFTEEAEALTNFVGDYSKKKFFLVDHHPLPLRLLASAENLRVLYRPDVFECALGPRSDMMVVAAIYEKQRSWVADIRSPVHDTMEVGMRRAAAIGGDLPGESLLALLRADCWAGIAMLGREDREFHSLPRGRRSPTRPPSEILKRLCKAAEEILGGQPQTAITEWEEEMPYDIGEVVYESGGNRRQRVKKEAVNGRDLEAIVTTLEVAALSLSPKDDSTFTQDQLIAEARSLCGDAIALQEEDIKIVLTKHNFIKKAGKGKLRIK